MKPSTKTAAAAVDVETDTKKRRSTTHKTPKSIRKAPPNDTNNTAIAATAATASLTTASTENDTTATAAINKVETKLVVDIPVVTAAAILPVIPPLPQLATCSPAIPLNTIPKPKLNVELSRALADKMQEELRLKRESRARNY